MSPSYLPAGAEESFTYFERWKVSIGKRFPDPDYVKIVGTTRVVDTAWATAPSGTYGYYTQDGEVRFFCNIAKDDPSGQQKHDLPLTGWLPGGTNANNIVPHGKKCPTTSGTLPSLRVAKGAPLPAWWGTPVDGPAKQFFDMAWLCCPCCDEYVDVHAGPLARR